MHNTGLVLFLVLDEELVRVHNHGGPAVIGIDAQVQDREAGIDSNEQPVLSVHPSVPHCLEHLFVQEQCYQPAKAIPCCFVQALTGRYAIACQ